MIHIAIDYNQDKAEEILETLVAGKIEKHPTLSQQTGVRFSNQMLNNYIQKELVHDDYIVTQNPDRGLSSMSSGQQRLTLLDYLFSTHPDYIILENIFDAIDISNIEIITQRLQELSTGVLIIQLFRRAEDILPFVKHLIVDLENEYKMIPIADYLKEIPPSVRFELTQEIPPPIEKIPSPDTLIEMKQVNVSYQGRPILENINWTVNKGEFWELVGANGTGKSTLLSMIYGDNPKAYGQDIALFGIHKGSGESVWQLKSYIGYFAPSLIQFFKGRHRVIEMVISGFRDHIGLYDTADRTEILLAKQWLSLVGYEHLSDCIFTELSVVQQRVVMILRSMVKHPPLLILDEPSMDLDTQSAAIIASLINDIATRTTTAIIYVSHRREPSLSPHYIYKLIPDERGSQGMVLGTK